MTSRHYLIAAYVLMAAAVSGGLYMAVGLIAENRIIIERRHIGVPCTDRQPQACERLLELIARACDRRPDLCEKALEELGRTGSIGAAAGRVLRGAARAPASGGLPSAPGRRPEPGPSGPGRAPAPPERGPAGSADPPGPPRPPGISVTVTTPQPEPEIVLPLPLPDPVDGVVDDLEQAVCTLVPCPAG